MSYGPAVLDKLTRQYTYLHDKLINKGVNVWYGREVGEDEEVAKMLLNDTPMADIEKYLIDNYADEEDY